MADWMAANDCLAQSGVILDKLGDVYESARTKVQLATVMAQDGRTAEASTACGEALQVFAQLGAEADRRRAQVLYDRLSSKEPSTR